MSQRFALVKELGKGGMGTVYRATDQILQRTVAIKVLQQIPGVDIGPRLRLEAQILARLLHDNIVRLYDFGLDGETYFFVMEEVDGTSLQKRWRRIGMAERLAILARVSDALDYAHHQGVIHRDVKPANVLLTASDVPKLSDFGLSLLAGANQEQGVVRGTPHYMSPEQARGKPLDHRTDLYSLGVILYECVAGAPPFQGASMAIMSQHVNSEPDPPRLKNPDVPEALEILIRELMAKKPDDRPSSGRVVSERLREVAAVLSSGTGVEASRAEGMPETEQATRMTVAAGAVAPAGIKPVEPVPVGGGKGTSLAARDMIEQVLRDPIALTPDDRYLTGHYLAYLLGGSRRHGFFGRRPLDPLNADRARLLLAMAYLGSLDDPQEAHITRAARLLDDRPDVRPALNPVVVLKYLAGRENPRKRKRFRQLRAQLQLASSYAGKHMTDERGVLNPGLMPQELEDLRRLAPERDELDDQLVLRWNRVAEIWRGHPEFRVSILRYATRRAQLDPASMELWPEVVYPLIERARWQRQLRSRFEALWDTLASNLRIPDAGNQMDRALVQAVPEQVVRALDGSAHAFEEVFSLEEPADEGDAGSSAVRGPATLAIRSESFADLGEEGEAGRGLVRLAAPDPFRYTLGEIRGIWQEAMAALRSPGSGKAARSLPAGPYRLTAIPSIRARSAGQAALQGMPNKQIEMLLPSFTGGGSAGKVVVAIWLYTNQSVVLTYVDNMANQRYVCWDAAKGQQANFSAADALNHHLYVTGLEAPDQLDRVLTRHFRPHNPV